MNELKSSSQRPTDPPRKKLAMELRCFATAFLVGLVSCLTGVDAQECGSGSIQLVGGTMGREGRLEVCYNGQWGTVCDDYFWHVEARVACRHVGYGSDGAVSFRNAYFGQGTGNIWLDNLYCTGNEGNIFSCPRGAPIGGSNCDHSEDAGIRCPPCVEGNVVFIRSSSKQGVPMLCHDGSYGTICDNGFDVNDAKVICRMLGYPTEGVQAFNGSTRFHIGYGDIWVNNLGCTGNEERLTDCAGQFYTANTCTHARDAGVICPSCDDWLGVQLWSAYGNTPKSEGMLQICESNGQWRGVCGKGSWCQDAKVACRDLGFEGSTNIQVFYNVDLVYGYIRGINPFQYNCVGDEDHFSDCPRTYDSTCNNPQWQTFGIRCANVQGEYNCTNGDVRFKKGNELSTNDEGRVEYCFENHWSPFCNLHDEEATIICKMKGHNTYSWAAFYDDERYGSAGLVSDFNTFECSWNAQESTLSDCNLKVITWQCIAQECSAEYGMQCFDPGMCDEGTYRLVDGDIEQEGRIEVCLNGVWGTICDSNWNSVDAYVFCRERGYDGSIAPVAYTDSFFGDGVYPIVWSNVKCNGWEKSFDDCTKSTYLNFWCTRARVAGVLCAEDCTDGDVRLVNGKDDTEGIVEVCYAGLWGLIDQGFWKDDNAEVICRQLGLRTEGAQAIINPQYTRPNKTIHLIKVNCFGVEKHIDECTYTTVTLTEGKTTYKNNPAAAVDCEPEPPTPPACVVMNVPKSGSDCGDGSIRVQGGHSEDKFTEGRLEYCSKGVWTAFCTLNELAAVVACRQLGYNAYNGATISSNGEFGSPTNYSIIQNVTCTSNSLPALDQCTIEVAGECIPFCPQSNVGIRCFDEGWCNFGDIRLSDGLIEQEGRVEICVDNVWGVICDDGFDKTDAHVACQQLGHPELEPIVFTESYFGDGIFPIVYSNMQCGGFENTLLDCIKSQYAQFSCPRSQIAGVLCGYDCKNGDVRLVGGSKDTEGTVEVCFENLWGLVADGGFDEKDASVICKLLGHSPDYVKSYLGSYYGKPNKTLLLSELQCGGDEVALDQCAYVFHSLVEGKALINEVNVAGVACLPSGCTPSSVSGTQCTSGDVRVQSGNTLDEGILQYCLNGTWSPFCSLEFDEASVACRQLGHPNNDYASVFDDGRFGPTSNTSYFTEFNCSNNATTFSSCPIDDLCISQCTNPLAIRCYNPTGCTEGDARLMNGYLLQEGRLELCISGVWSTICDTDFDQSDALAACTQLGYDYAEPVFYTGSMFGDGEGPIVYSNMMCEGFERNLADCNKNMYPNIVCSRKNVVGVLCKDGCTEGDVKLVGGSDNEGTVLFCQDGLWSMISDSGWDSLEAQVACRQLGFTTEGATPRSGSYYGKVNKTIAAYNFGCVNTENSLADCNYVRYTYDQGKLFALNTSVAGLYCTPPDPTIPPTVCPVTPTLSPSPVCKTGDVQLANGQNSGEGRLMYCYNNQWSPFCSLDGNTASVACKYKGYSTASASIFTNGEFGNSPLNYSLFVDLTCTGSEDKLSDCQISSSGCVPTCTNNIGIRCYTDSGCTQGDIRLVDGAIQQQGRVEICVSGIWSTICATGWDKTNAYVVCQQLGFGQDVPTAFVDSVFGSGTGPVVYSDVQCVGHETDIMNCPKKVYPDITCTAGNAAGVMCADDCNDGDVMLVGGSNSYEGTIEICFDNLWGLISHTGWSDKDAAVACSQLGLATNNPTAVKNSRYGKPDKTVHLTNVYCSGKEAKLTDCTAHKESLNDGTGYNVAGIMCPPIPSTSPTMTREPTVAAVPATESTGVPTSTLYLISGVFAVCAILAVLSVVGLFVAMLIVYLRRRGGQDMFSAEKKSNRMSKSESSGAMPLYAVVNRNRDSMVSFSSNDDGKIDLG